jgi:hypothetical protein
VDGLRAALETTYYEANKGVAAQKAQLWTLTSCRPETSSLQTNAYARGGHSGARAVPAGPRPGRSADARGRARAQRRAVVPLRSSPLSFVAFRSTAFDDVLLAPEIAVLEPDPSPTLRRDAVRLLGRTRQRQARGAPIWRHRCRALCARRADAGEAVLPACAVAGPSPRRGLRSAVRAGRTSALWRAARPRACGHLSEGAERPAPWAASAFNSSSAAWPRRVSGSVAPHTTMRSTSRSSVTRRSTSSRASHRAAARSNRSGSSGRVSGRRSPVRRRGERRAVPRLLVARPANRRAATDGLHVALRTQRTHVRMCRRWRPAQRRGTIRLSRVDLTGEPE